MNEIRLVTDYLDRAIARCPDKVAFEDEWRKVTFRAFREEAYRTAGVLIAKGFLRRPVVVCLKRSIENLSVSFGISYSGNFYVPVDSDAPSERIKKICGIVKPALVITSRELLDRFDGVDAELLAVEDLPDEAADEISVAARRAEMTDTDILYITFTSGSTGTPKGVVIPHKGVIAYLGWAVKALRIHEDTVVGDLFPFSFSSNVLPFYQAVCCGTKCVILPKRLFSVPVDMLRFMERCGVNMLYCVPSVLCRLADMELLEHDGIRMLKTVAFAGEIMPTKYLNKWRAALQDTLFVNMYGPAEFTDIATYYVAERELDTGEPVPIGACCDNARVLLLDEEQREIENTGETGELYLSGAQLAYGYYNDPEKTREVFVQNPLNTAYPETVYRTGDYAYRNEYGELVFVGRRDNQIKLNGYRIELGEIETVGASLPGVDRCCCIYHKQDKRLALFYTGRADTKEVKKMLKEALPRYMIPGDYIRMDSMPLNENGKIDRKQLAAMTDR